MRILIWGGDSWANQGDGAILAGTLHALRQAAPDASVVVASDRPRVTTSVHQVDAVPRGSWRFIRTLLQADLVLWGGGQLLQNASSKLFLVVQLVFLAGCVLLGKRVVCYAQGVGPVSGRVSRFWTRVLVSRLALVTVRDHVSATRLRELGLPPDRVRVVADPSFSLPAASCQEVEALRQRLSLAGPFAVIAVRRWGHYRGGWLPVRFSRRRVPAEQLRWFEDFCASVAAAGDHLAGTLGLRVLLLPMCPGGDQEDEVVACQVRIKMAFRDKAMVMDGVLAPGLLKGLLGQAELALAMRTHTGMLATAMGTPVASLSYQGKGEALMAELGLNAYLLPVEETTPQSIIELVERTWRDRTSIRAQLQQSIPCLQERAAEAIPLALSVAQWGVHPHNRAPSTTSWRGDLRLGSAYRALLAPALGLTPAGPRVLEVGAADGRLLERLGASQPLALDIAPEPQLGQEVSYVRGDGRYAPFNAGAFDTVVAFDVLEHVQDDASLAQELVRLVRPGGTLWVSVPSRNMAVFPSWLTPWVHRNWGHLRPGYSQEQLVSLFRGCGHISMVSWNEPVYRGSYLFLKALSLVSTRMALALLSVVVKLDGRFPRGDRGHYFCMIRMPDRDAQRVR